MDTDAHRYLSCRFCVSLLLSVFICVHLWFKDNSLDLGEGASGLETFRALPPAHQRPAPTFTLPDQHGAPVRLADLRGKVVVIQFWVTW
jgi:cytochrome oxidase Cu insertion factor (SCO1/SenC/PrrC family)